MVVPVIAVVECNAHQGHPLTLGGGHQRPPGCLSKSRLHTNASLAQPQELVVVGQVSLANSYGGGGDDPAEIMI